MKKWMIWGVQTPIFGNIHIITPGEQKMLDSVSISSMHFPISTSSSMGFSKIHHLCIRQNCPSSATKQGKIYHPAISHLEKSREKSPSENWEENAAGGLLTCTPFFCAASNGELKKFASKNGTAIFRD